MGINYNSGTGVQHQNVHQNGVEDVYRKLPSRYLIS